jgi:nucleoside-diphosphate-sugar epimerase
MFSGRSLLPVFGEPNFSFQRINVQNSDSLEPLVDGCHAVVHLAAIVGDPACAQKPELARAVNLDASLALHTLATRSGVARFAFASTCSNYGRMDDAAELATEEHPLRPLSLYAETKVAVEQHLLRSDATTAVTVLRFATLYGLSSRMRFDLTVNEFVKRMLVDRSLTVYGEQFWRPYLHVRDAARSVLTVLEAPREAVAGAVFNVGDTRENYRKSDLLDLLEKKIPGSEVRRIKKAEDPRDYRVSFDRIHKSLSFACENRVPDGMDEIIAAIRSGIFESWLSDETLYNTIQS